MIKYHSVPLKQHRKGVFQHMLLYANSIDPSLYSHFVTLRGILTLQNKEAIKVPESDRKPSGLQNFTKSYLQIFSCEKRMTRMHPEC